MKKSLMILLAILMTCLLLASCNSEVGEVSSSELVNVKIAGGSKGLGADPVGEEVTVEGLYWYYKATKVAGNPNRAGQTDWKQVKEGTGLIGANLGSFAKGTWNFEFEGYTLQKTSEGENPVRYSASCSNIVVNSATSLTLTLIEGTITQSGFKLGKGDNPVFFTAGGASYPAETSFTLHVAENGIELIEPIVNALTQTGNTASFSTNSYTNMAVGRHVLDFWVTTPDIQDVNKTYVMAQGSIAFVVKKGVQYDIYGDLENLDVDYYEVTVGSYGGVTTEQAVSNFATDVVLSGGVDITAAGTASGTSGQTIIAFNSNQTAVAAKFNAVTSVKTTVSTAADIESANTEAPGTFVIDTSNGMALGAVEIELVDETGAVVALNSSDNITVTVQIPIVKGLGNDAQFVVQSNGSTDGISDISYNSVTGVLSFTTTHFSTFVIQSDVILMTSDGKKAYKSLDDVLECETVKLIQDLALTSTVNLEKSFTLDLNNHNITATNARALHVKEGTLTLTGNGIISANKIGDTGFSEDSSVIRVGNDSGTSAGLVVGKDVTISSSYCYGITVFGEESNGQSLVVNGKVNVSGAVPAISGNGNGFNTSTNITIGDGAVITSAVNAIYHPQAGTLSIGAATLTGGIEVKSGNTTIAMNGPTVTANGTKNRVTNNNGCSTTGYAVAVVENSSYKGNALVVINGGFYTGAVGVVTDSETTRTGSIVINGGNFTNLSIYDSDDTNKVIFGTSTSIWNNPNAPVYKYVVSEDSPGEGWSMSTWSVSVEPIIDDEDDIVG